MEVYHALKNPFHSGLQRGPIGVYELARWRSSTAVVGHRTRNYSQAATSALWAMTGYNEYYIIEFPDGTYEHPLPFTVFHAKIFA